MTNDQFKLYLAKRLSQVQKDLATAKREGDEPAKKTAEENLKLLESFAKIARGPGANLRRVRRDYERRLAKQGQRLTL